MTKKIQIIITVATEAWLLLKMKKKKSKQQGMLKTDQHQIETFSLV